MNCKKFEFRFKFFSMNIFFLRGFWDCLIKERASQHLFLDLIRFMLGWFLYLLFIPEIVSFSRERVWEEELCLFAVFKIGMFIKEQDFIIFSKSNFRTCVDLILNFGFIIFQKTLLSVTLHMSGLPKRHPNLNSQSYYFRNKVKKILIMEYLQQR